MELSRQKLDELWRKYKLNGDEDARQTLIIYYSPLAKYVAGRIASSLPASVDVQDLISNGILGLIDAIEKFDPSLKIKFETYAISRIRGAIIDSLRALDWLPRSLRYKSKEIDRVYAELESKLKREPTDEELAEALDIPVDDLRKLLSELSYSSMVALEDMVTANKKDDSEFTIMQTVADTSSVDPFEMFDDEETKEYLIEAIKSLPEKERKVIIHYYYSGMTLKEIGNLLGVSESRVSQIHSKALLKLKSKLKDYISV